MTEPIASGDTSQCLLIRGIPRSGTSYLCNRLHRYDDCVALNEPQEMITCIRQPADGGGIVDFFARTRSSILAGASVMNKMHDGEVAEDTWIDENLVAYTPRVISPTFLLAAKLTVVVLNNLDRIRAEAPDLRIVACVRDPYDTIASWKMTFPHLANANALRGLGPSSALFADAALTNPELATISRTRDVSELRAAWWASLAGIILRWRDRGLAVVRYEDLVERPVDALEAVVGTLRPGRLTVPMEPSQVRSRREHLNAADCLWIDRYCRKPAAALGLGS